MRNQPGYDDEEEVPPSPCTPLPPPSKRFRSVEQEMDDMFTFSSVDIARLTAHGDEKLMTSLRSLKKGVKGGLTMRTDVLNYWRERAPFIDRDVAKMASMALAAPASQVTVERAFSILPLILSDRNTRLNDDYVEKYALVKLNGKLFKPLIRE